MGDLDGFGLRRLPTAEEVVGRLKDDGDFDALLHAIIRKVKDNVYEEGDRSMSTYERRASLREL